jgi:hypothetical protein
MNQGDVMEKTTKLLVILGTISGILWIPGSIIISYLISANANSAGSGPWVSDMTLQMVFMLTTAQLVLLVPSIILGLVSVKKNIGRGGITALSGILLGCSIGLLFSASFLAGVLFLAASIVGFVRAGKIKKTAPVGTDSASN